MTEIDPKNLEEMKRYLFHESSDAEREAMEEHFFSDEDFFYDLMELENSLADAYARGELAGDDAKRFAASLENSPERRAKVANAAALKSFISEENRAAQKSVPVAAPPAAGFWEKILAFFTGQMTAMQYASAALIFLLVCGTGFLLYERVRLNRELADLRENQKSVEELQKQEQALQNQLNETRERERNLQDRIGEKQGESEVLTEQLEREKTQRERLENELERLKKLQKNLPPPNQPLQPTIATIVLSPFLGSRGGSGNNVKTLKLDSNIKSVAATLQLPKDANADLFLVRFKGKIVASSQKPRLTKSGLKFVTVTLPADQLSIGEDNVISVFGSDGVRYDFILRVQK